MKSEARHKQFFLATGSEVLPETETLHAGFSALLKKPFSLAKAGLKMAAAGRRLKFCIQTNNNTKGKI